MEKWVESTRSEIIPCQHLVIQHIFMEWLCVQGTQLHLPCKAQCMFHNSQVYWELGWETGVLDSFCHGVGHHLTGRIDIQINVVQCNTEHGISLNVCQEYNELIYWHIPTVKYSAAVKNEKTVLKAMLDEKSKFQKYMQY